METVMDFTLGGSKITADGDCSHEIKRCLLLGRKATINLQFSSFQLLSHVRLFATPGTAACQASLSFTISQSLLKCITIELAMPLSHLVICCLHRSFTFSVFLSGVSLWSLHCCSVAQLCPTLCDPMDCSTPGFPVLHQLLELAQTHVH